MRKQTICICENKDAELTADQRLCFRHTDSTIHPSLNLLALCCDCTAWFVSDPVGNPNCWFYHAQAQVHFVRFAQMTPQPTRDNNYVNAGNLCRDNTTTAVLNMRLFYFLFLL